MVDSLNHDSKKNWRNRSEQNLSILKLFLTASLIKTQNSIQIKEAFLKTAT